MAYDEFHRCAKQRDKNAVIPEVSWPIHSVVFVHPGKRVYGKGEIVPWELKLFGKDASHEFFIEVILPAMEEASYNREAHWSYRNCLWGNFDIDSIYIANKNRWDPLATGGRLDLNYKANSLQYSEDLFKKYTDKVRFSYRKLIWLTPFDFTTVFSATKDKVQAAGEETHALDATPTLYGILDAFLSRLHVILEGRRTAPENVWSFFSQEERDNLHELMGDISGINMTSHAVVPSKKVLGRWIGEQTFASIPHTLLPYLDLASHIHIGRQTHAGCGTFQIFRYPVKYD